MPQDPAALKIIDLLAEDRRRVADANTREMERVREKMDEIRANPQTHSQKTMTGSFLESIGIRRNPKAKPTEVELNLEEIDAREAREREERHKRREKGEDRPVLVKGKGKAKDRARSRRRP